MGIINRLKAAKENVHEYKEKRDESREQKHEAERREWKEKSEKYDKEKSYYADKQAFRQKKAAVERARIENTPIVGTLYKSAGSFSGSKFAKATVKELDTTFKPSRRAGGPRRKATRQYARQDFFNSGFNPVEENLRMQQIQNRQAEAINHPRNTPSFNNYPRGKPQSRGYKQPNIAPNGSIGLNPQKIDKRLRRMMGV